MGRDIVREVRHACKEPLILYDFEWDVRQMFHLGTFSCDNSSHIIYQVTLKKILVVTFNILI